MTFLTESEQFNLIPGELTPPRCVSCRYWIEHDFPRWENGALRYKGDCHRHAPRLTLADIESEENVRNLTTNRDIMAGLFPGTDWSDFCGDHIAVTGAEDDRHITIRQPAATPTPSQSS